VLIVSFILRLQFGAYSSGGSNISGIEQLDHNTQTPPKTDKRFCPVEICRDVTNGNQSKIHIYVSKFKLFSFKSFEYLFSIFMYYGSQQNFIILQIISDSCYYYFILISFNIYRDQHMTIKRIQKRWNLTGDEYLLM
jgi:hypothetical protein